MCERGLPSGIGSWLSVEPKGVGSSGNPAASLMRCVPKLHIRIMVCRKGIHSARVPMFGNLKTAACPWL